MFYSFIACCLAQNGIYYNILINALSKKHNLQVFNSTSNILLVDFYIMKMSKVLTCTVCNYTMVFGTVFFLNIEICLVVEDMVNKWYHFNFRTWIEPTDKYR